MTTIEGMAHARAKATVAKAARIPGALAWTGLRISLAGVFLWAFADKMWGLGHTTPPARAWLAGGSPASGFLQFGTRGPLAEFYQGLAGNPLVDVLFMLGLLGIGLALATGMGVRIAGYAGAAMMLLMYAAALPPENNPLVDDHIVYAAALLGLAAVRAGRWHGLGEWWSNTPLVRRYPVLE